MLDTVINILFIIALSPFVIVVAIALFGFVFNSLHKLYLLLRGRDNEIANPGLTLLQMAIFLALSAYVIIRLTD